MMFTTLAALCLSTILNVSFATSSFEFKHHDNQELLKVLERVHEQCPNITRIYTLSEPSVLGVPLYVIEFSTNLGQHVPLKPEFRYIANMHGNEVLGRELLLKLADHLCESYLNHDEAITKLIQMTRIHLMPSMNPDGWAESTKNGGTDYLIGRANANGVDLNRDFPDLDKIMFGNELYDIDHNNHLMDQLKHLDHPIQQETLAVMRLIMSTPFVLSANLHGGDLVANYPYDASRSGASSEYSITPDDETFRSLALSYSLVHPTMGDPKKKSCDRMDGINFGKSGGIINGAKWYSVRGGLQDFNYLSSNDFEITLELGCQKYPPAEDLEKEWNNNKDALLNFMAQIHTGIKGLVRCSDTAKPIPNAIIHVQNITELNDTHMVNQHIDHDITSVGSGDYFRLLTPGQYLVTASHDGYKPQTRRVKVTNPKSTEAVRLDFWLKPIDSENEPVELAAEYPQGRFYSPIEEKRGGHDQAEVEFEPEIKFHPLIQEEKVIVDEQPPQVDDLNEAPDRDWLVKYMYQNIGNM